MEFFGFVSWLQFDCPRFSACKARKNRLIKKNGAPRSPPFSLRHQKQIAKRWRRFDAIGFGSEAPYRFLFESTPFRRRAPRNAVHAQNEVVGRAHFIHFRSRTFTARNQPWRRPLVGFWPSDSFGKLDAFRRWLRDWPRQHGPSRYSGPGNTCQILIRIDRSTCTSIAF